MLKPEESTAAGGLLSVFLYIKEIFIITELRSNNSNRLINQIVSICKLKVQV